MITHRGKTLLLQWALRNEDPPAGFHIAMVTAASPPSASTATLGDLAEISAGNGYTAGGAALSRDAIGWDELTQDDANAAAYTRAKDIRWAASGGAIPASGGGARYAVLTDDDPVIANRQVIAYFDLGGDTVALDGQSIVLADLEIRLQECV